MSKKVRILQNLAKIWKNLTKNGQFSPIFAKFWTSGVDSGVDSGVGVDATLGVSFKLVQEISNQAYTRIG